MNVTESPLVQPNATPQQPMTQRAEELSSEHLEAIPWLPGPVLDEVDNQWQQDLHAVSNVDKNMNSCLLFHSSASAYPAHIPPSIQLRNQQCQLKPSELPKVVKLGSSQRCLFFFFFFKWQIFFFF